MSKLHKVLVTFGTAGSGRLGHGFPLNSQFFPRIVKDLVGQEVTKVSCGGAHTAAITADGTLYTFGLNEDGQLGHSKPDKVMPVPLEVGLPEPIKSVAAGDRHTVALTQSGEVWTFGRAGEGQLGIGEVDSENIRQVEPRFVKALKGIRIVDIAAGSTHSLALSDKGEVYSWGHSDFGALGHGALTRGGPNAPTTLLPRLIRSLSIVKMRSVTCGPYSSGSITESGQVFTWGHGINWQLGHGVARHEPLPRPVATLSRVSSIAIGQIHSLAVLADGRVVTWGQDECGNLGQGEATVKQRFISTPRLVGNLPNCVHVSAGWHHSLAVSEMGGKLFSWGGSGAGGQMGGWVDYGGGQLGLGGDSGRWAPEQVKRIHASEHRAFDLRIGFLKPWRVLATAAGRGHSAAVVEIEMDPRDTDD